MASLHNKRVLSFWVLTGTIFVVALSMLVWYTPVEQTMGAIQKLYYIHLPVAICTFGAALAMFVASVSFLWQRELWMDDLASAAGVVTVLLCTVVLLTGMIWGKSAWGHWWAWTPPLTFSLVLWVLYLGYFVVRSSISGVSRRAVVCSLYSVAIFLDVPLVYLSVKLMPDIHPSSMTMGPRMRLTLFVWFIPVTLLSAGLIVTRFRVNQRIRTSRGCEDERVEDSLVSGDSV